jgi:hypothetical protein
MWNILKKAVVQKNTDAVKELKNVQNLALRDIPKSSARLILLKYW